MKIKLKPEKKETERGTNPFSFKKKKKIFGSAFYEKPSQIIIIHQMFTNFVFVEKKDRFLFSIFCLFYKYKSFTIH